MSFHGGVISMFGPFEPQRVRSGYRCGYGKGTCCFPPLCTLSLRICTRQRVNATLRKYCCETCLKPSHPTAMPAVHRGRHSHLNRLFVQPVQANRAMDDVVGETDVSHFAQTPDAHNSQAVFASFVRDERGIGHAHRPSVGNGSSRET